MGITKKRKAIAAKVDKNKEYSLADASSLVKGVSIYRTIKFSEVHFLYQG